MCIKSENSSTQGLLSIQSKETSISIFRLAQRMLTVQLSDVDIATNMGHASMLLQLPIAPTMANKGIAITM